MAFHQDIGGTRHTFADLKTLLDEIGLLPDARYLWSYGMDHGRFDDVVAAIAA